MTLMMTTKMSFFQPHPKYNLYHLLSWASCTNTEGLLLPTLASLQSDGCFSKANQIPSPSCSHPSKILTLANMPAKSGVRSKPTSHPANTTDLLPAPTLASRNMQSPPSRALALALPSALLRSLLQVLALIPPSLRLGL